MKSTIPPGNLDARMARVEDLLDRWLDLFEASLEALEEGAAGRLAASAPKLPEPAKLTDLGAVFTITQRVLQIQMLRHKLAALEANPHDDSGFEFDPSLLEESVSDVDGTE